MKNLLVLFVLGLFIVACGGNTDQSDNSAATDQPVEEAAPVDDGKGIGEIKSVTLNNPLDPDMVKRGKAIYEMKCAACHKLTAMRVVGPGWLGLTEKRKPEWIMNMTTNVDVMLEKDPEARELLKQCLVRMPNQNVSIGDARDILEFMFAIDGQEVGS